MGMSEEEIVDLVVSKVRSEVATTTESDYDAALKEFSGIGVRDPRGNRGPFITSSTGKMLYPNGVIYDPATKQTLYPPRIQDQAQMAGSDAWLREVQDKWSDDKAEEWRKKLWDDGYDSILKSEKGGWGSDLVDALAEYHYRRYANGGKVQPMTPGGKKEDVKQLIRDTYDPVMLRDEVKAWGDVPFGESLTDEESDYFADKVIEVAARLAKQNPDWTVDQIQEGAKGRVFKRFTEDPQVKGLIKEQEDQEVSYKIRDSVVSLSQALGA